MLYSSSYAARGPAEGVSIPLIRAWNFESQAVDLHQRDVSRSAYQRVDAIGQQHQNRVI